MVIRRENRSRNMASNETMEAYDEEESLTFSQLHTPLSQNPSKSPLDVSRVQKINLSGRLSICDSCKLYSLHVRMCTRCLVLLYCLKKDSVYTLCSTHLHS